MSQKINMGNNRVFTCDQLASALTIVIKDVILKPKLTQDRFVITLEYKCRINGEIKRLRQCLSTMLMQSFNGTVEEYIYSVRMKIKSQILKEELRYDE